MCPSPFAVCHSHGDGRDFRVAAFERVSCCGGVAGAFKEVRVDLEDDVGVGVSELAADEDDVEAARDGGHSDALAASPPGELVAVVDVRGRLAEGNRALKPIRGSAVTTRHRPPIERVGRAPGRPVSVTV
jgi:hypothetical protein